MKIITVVGARPQFIKAAVVSRAIAEFNRKKNRLREVLVHTGQHYDYFMDQVFFEELQIPKPHYHLGVGSGSHAKQTGMMLERIETVLQKEKPDLVMVYGDTNSTLAGALSAAKLDIPIAHVEAGLRSYDRTMPEEINRVLTDHLSTFLFCPTDQAVLNLLREGIKNGKTRMVKNVGDVMYDSILFYSKVAEEKSTILRDLVFKTRYETGDMSYYLATLHRAENTDDPKRLKSILAALNKLGESVPVILPLHPRTRKVIEAYHLFSKFKHIQFTEPISYLHMVELEKHARAILTDSGGVQKEAYWLKTPCVTLREVTEWGYTVEEGWNIISGWKTEAILQAVQKIGALGRKKKKVIPEKRGAGKTIVRLLAQFHH